MPNVKIFVDEDLYAARRTEIRAALQPLRAALCAQLGVTPAACQLAVLPVMGLPDQPLANMEYQYLATPARTPDAIRAASAHFSALLTEALGCALAVRATPLDPETYVALK
jgi:hypothetical protein